MYKLNYMRFIWNKNNGFTILEAIISVFISSLTLLLLITGLNQVKVMNESTISQSQTISSSIQYVISDRQIEWHSFLNQLEFHLKDSIFIEIKNNQLIVEEWDEGEQRYCRVSYEQTKSGKKNFRRSKANGNNTMLQDIQRFSLIKNDGWLHLDFKFKNGESYTGKIWIESWIDK